MEEKFRDSLKQTARILKKDSNLARGLSEVMEENGKVIDEYYLTLSRLPDILLMHGLASIYKALGRTSKSNKG